MANRLPSNLSSVAPGTDAASRRPLQSSASLPVVVRAAQGPVGRGPPPSSFLPAIGDVSRSPKKQSKKGSASFSAWPAVNARQPDALNEIEKFLADELSSLDAVSDVPAEVRLGPHREALDLFINHFGTYAGPLSAIKRAYEAQIDALRAALRRKSREQDAAQAEFEATHQRITSTLHEQLKATQRKLDDARWEIKQLQDGNVDDSGNVLSDKETEQLSSGSGFSSVMTASPPATAMGPPGGGSGGEAAFPWSSATTTSGGAAKGGPGFGGIAAMSGRGSPQSVESGTNSDDNTNNSA